MENGKITDSKIEAKEPMLDIMLSNEFKNIKQIKEILIIMNKWRKLYPLDILSF